jgi:hypothetical protein
LRCGVFRRLTIVVVSDTTPTPTGTRGAVSTEQFLAHGCAVVFLHRTFSLQPYLRELTKTGTNLLDDLEVVDGNLQCRGRRGHLGGWLLSLTRHRCV